MHNEYRSMYIKLQRPPYMGTLGNWFVRFEIVHNFKLFGNAGVITLPWL
jgi:hypothetical protein